MLIFAFQSEIWIAENFNFSVFEDFCLSLSWKYRFSQNVNHAKVQSKTNKYGKFHFDLTRRRLSKRSRFKKLGMVPKKLYRSTLTGRLICLACEICLSKTNISYISDSVERIVGSTSNSSELNDSGDQAADSQQQEAEETILESSTSRYGRKRTRVLRDKLCAMV